MNLIPLWQHFETFPEPRDTTGNFKHLLKDIIIISVCGFICDLESFEDIADFARDEEAWFRTFLELPNGIPSHDTIERVLSMLDADEFERRFSAWAVSVVELIPGTTISIDGKSIRRSFDAALKKTSAHIVSAFVSRKLICIGQLKVEDKTNEITAIPKLLETLYLNGCIVTIDAMGCQREIAHQIIEEKAADYVLGLKGNQGTLHAEVKEFFNEADTTNFEGVSFSFAATVDKGHGRIEERKCWVANDVDWFQDKDKWANLNSFIMIESTRWIGEKQSIEKRYYIVSPE